jgi:hypothetical protein
VTNFEIYKGEKFIDHLSNYQVVKSILPHAVSLLSLVNKRNIKNTTVKVLFS